MKTELGAVIIPTGDTTDRKAEIENKLSTYGYCEFLSGQYYISGPINLTTGMTVKGQGKKSILIKSNGGADGFFYIHNYANNITIKDLQFKGTNTAIPATDVGSNGDWAINFAEHAGASHIENCFFNGLTRCGILKTSGYSVSNDSCVSITDCVFRFCGKGIELPEYGEFTLACNCAFQENYFGAWVQGGNNRFANCSFDANEVGFRLYDDINGTNDGHGSCVGCSFNHNKTNSIKISNINFGFIFNSCIMFSSDVEVDNSSGIMFSDCIAQGNKSATDHANFTFTDCNGYVSLNNCTFIYNPILTHTNCPYYSFTACKQTNGTEVTSIIPLFGLTKTYVTNSYVTESNYSDTYYKYDRMFIAKVNINITNSPGNTFRQIGTISLPSNLIGMVSGVFASQSNQDNLLVQITAAGVVSIYCNGTATGWYRGVLIGFF